MCPILFVDEKTRLCKGHIVPKSGGGSKWVVQRKDVDNFFGSFVEADFAHGLEMRSLRSDDELLEYISKHRMSRKTKLTAISADGFSGRIDAIHLGLQYAESQARHERPSMSRSLIFDLSMELPTIVTCLHTVHLGLFEICGYTYAADKTGQFIGYSVLGGLFRTFRDHISAGRKMMFSEVDEDLHVSLTASRNIVRPIPRENLVIDDEVVKKPFSNFYVAWDGDRPFATIHYLRFGDEFYAVLVPSTFDDRSAALVCSKVPVSFKIGKGRFCRGKIEVSAEKTHAIWPCGSGSVNGTVPLSVLAAGMRESMRSWRES